MTLDINLRCECELFPLLKCPLWSWINQYRNASLCKGYARFPYVDALVEKMCTGVNAVALPTELLDDWDCPLYGVWSLYLYDEPPAYAALDTWFCECRDLSTIASEDAFWEELTEQGMSAATQTSLREYFSQLGIHMERISTLHIVQRAIESDLELLHDCQEGMSKLQSEYQQAINNAPFSIPSRLLRIRQTLDISKRKVAALTSKDGKSLEDRATLSRSKVCCSL